MASQTPAAQDRQKPFYFAEECSLALLHDPKTGKRICMDGDLFRDMASGFRAGWDPLTHRPDG